MSENLNDEIKKMYQTLKQGTMQDANSIKADMNAKLDSKKNEIYKEV